MTYEEGWRAAIATAVAAITAYTEKWQENGPSKAAADAITTVIGRLKPLPHDKPNAGQSHE